MQTYHPSEYVIIETASINFSDDNLALVLNDTYPEIASNSSGILAFLSSNQFLRRVYSQIRLPKAKDSIDNIENNNKKSNSQLINNVLGMLNKIALEYNTKIIIFYHPTTEINSDGSLLLPNDIEERKEFDNLCKQNGIIFLDMTERFKYEYEAHHLLPHGFINSSVGKGHLNKYGHQMIADELYKIITNEEG